MKLLFLTIYFAFSFSFLGFAQSIIGFQAESQDTSVYPKIFKLGEVTILAKQNDLQFNRISSDQMEQQNKMDVAKALNLLPGVTLTSFGARNESTVSVRGFDLRQVPVYMDGIPVYVPYDGYVDLARFTTFDLAAIDVAKGFSSVLYGPNSLGGAINLISQKPISKFDLDGAIGMIQSNGYRGNINIGSNLGKFYLQGGYSYLHRDSYRMSEQYDSTKNENGKNRDNSFRTDQKINFKIGWTPTANHEYVFGYIYQQGQKGTPVYCGIDSLNSLLKKPRFWQWPHWDKETYFLLSNTKLNEKNYFNTRIYYDKFKNSLQSYDDATYKTQTKPYAFESLYNDYAVGANAEYGSKIFAKNLIKLAFQYKTDVHRENNLNEPIRQIIDNTYTLGIENIYTLTDKLLIIPGLSYSARKNQEAQDYDSKTKTISDFPTGEKSNAYNGQLGVFYYLKNNNSLRFSIAHKTRFATMKDRYSYRFGTALPNPNLKPETTTNYELNYKGKFSQLTFQTALFYSNLSNAIISINNIQPGISQMQNAGKAEFKGAEASLEYMYTHYVSLGTNVSYIERTNISNPSVHFTDVPNSKVNFYVKYIPTKPVTLLFSAEYNS